MSSLVGIDLGTTYSAIAALDVIEREPHYAALPLAKATRFAELAGLPEPASPIVPLIIGEAEATLAAARALETEGFLVVAIRPPTVPAGTARLRFTFTAAHSDRDIERVAEIVRAITIARPAMAGSP